MRDPEIRFLEPGQLDWSEVFGRCAPVELELGFGKGRFLLSAAAARPEHDWLGVEQSRKWFREGKRRLLADCPANLRLHWGEALDFLQRRVPDASLSAVHVYHPDPWPKRRHAKRRLISSAFLVQVERVLAPGGELRITTDHHSYAQLIAMLLSESRGLRAAPWPAGADPDTHFEAKYRREGRAIHRFLVRRQEEA